MQGWFLLGPLSLACRVFVTLEQGLKIVAYLLPVSSYVLPSVYVCAQISSSYKGISHIGLGSIHMTSFYLFKTPSPNTIKF